MRAIWGIDPGWGITVLRVAMAMVFIHGGWLKWFQFGVTTGVTAGFTKYGLPVPMAFAVVASVMELFGGLALLIGLFGRWLGLYYIAEFTIAFFWVRLRMQGFMDGRLEMMLLAGAILIFLNGSGKAAVDECWPEKA